MNRQRPFLWIIASIVLIILGGLALPGATARFTLAQPLLEPDAEAAGPSGQSAPGMALALPPTTVTTDEEGYTLWTVKWTPWAWCVPYSRITYPFDLGMYDPTALGDASLTLTYNQGDYSFGKGYIDPTWTIALNGKPPDEWRSIGTLSGPVINPETWPTSGRSSVVVPFDAQALIDGENNVWLRQHDFCPSDILEDSACTCVEIHTVQLRARGKLGVRSVSPEPDARNVRPDQSKDSEIRVKFTIPVSITTVNQETFQLFYYDQALNQVVVDGSVRQLSDIEFVFRPAQALKGGIRYEVQVWDKDEALRHGRDQWVTDLGGDPLENGYIWSFWTLPTLQVQLVPVQVLQDMPLIVNKATALRTFIRWEKHPDVFALDQLSEIEVHDLTLRWSAIGGGHQGRVGWRDSGYGWNLPYNAQNALRKRDYLTFDTSASSYDKFERMAGRDSITYFDFIPLDSGTYDFLALVTLLDQKGEPNIHVGVSVMAEALGSRRLNLFYRAVAVGADYGATGPRDLSESLLDSGNVTRALLPVPSITRAATPGAMPYYRPTTSLWIGNWTAPPSWPYYRQIKYLLQELSMMCVRSKGIYNQPCDAMIGYVPKVWLGANGITLPDAAPWGALAQHDTTAYGNLHFVPVHELGHLFGFIEHNDALRGGEGYFVSRRRDLRSSVAALSPQTNRTINVIRDFMITEPEEIPLLSPLYRQNPYLCEQCLWITPSRYQSLLNRFTGGLPLLSVANTLALANAPLLLVSGAITPTTGETVLFPWYELDPGPWTPPNPGPYEIVFVDTGGQVIAGYTHTFDVASTLVPSDSALAQSDDGEAFFMFAIPYPSHAARVQVYHSADNALLAERVVSAAPPALTLDPPAPVWSGDQTLTWHTDAGTRYFAVDISTDGGASWEAMAINLTTPETTLHTASLPNTPQALVRVDATDGWHTTRVVTGPFTIANPPIVSYVAPPPGSVADPALPIVVGFRDAMDAATINTHTLTLTGGPYGTVSGVVTYNDLEREREATFTPHTPLAYATIYTGQVGVGVRDSAGASLPVTFTWSFTTTIDTLPPVPLAVSPEQAALRTPPNATVLVLWDKALDPATLPPERFTLATAEGAPVDGVIAYDAAAHSLTFRPAAALLTDTLYVATLHPGIADLVGNETVGEYRWAFRTGGAPSALAFTGSYADWGQDTNGDGLYEQLSIQVGVQTPVSGAFTLQGILADSAGAEIGWTESVANLQPGAHFIALHFNGAEIGGRGVDGPYTLTRLTLSAPNGQVVWAIEAHRTFAYAASRFPAPLRFGKLPDLLLRPGTSLDPAFNVYAYAQHATQDSAALTYTLLANTNPRVGVTLDASGNIRVNPEPGWGDEVWTGSTLVTLQAAYGSDRVQDTFQVTVGWAKQVYLPVTLRNFSPSSVQLTRSYWQIAFSDGFEQDAFVWRRWSSHSGALRRYFWGRRDCGAYSGQYSAWPFGDSDDGALLPCGAYYPAEYLASTMMAGPFNLQYTSQAEFRMKVWTNLAPGDELCAMVTNWDLGEANMWQAQYEGVCRTGQTAGWEDLVLDLANVPTFGNLLGQEKVWVAVRFRSPQGTTATRPVGAYVDDAMLRLCPLGLSCETATSVNWPSVSDVPAVSAGVSAAPAGVIGGYDAAVGETALAREANGRVHALWTGRLNPHFDPFVFYASTADGVNWTPFQILSYAAGSDPQIAVDDTRQRVHLMYRADGIIHHVVKNGVVSPPLIVDYTLESRFGLTTGPTRPQLTVASSTGHVHAVWQQVHFKYINATTIASRFHTWYAYWNGASWSARRRVINDDDTWDSTLAADTGGGIMLAWFQRWGQSQDGTGAGEPTVPRTAYGLAATPGSFPLRQAVSAPYTMPRTDASILLTYSAGDGKYYMASRHLMYPTHSRVYRYVWANAAWTGPLDVAGNTSGWAMPYYVGAAKNTPLIRYVYNDNDVLKMRTETNGVLGAAQTVASYLSARGYSGAPAAYFTDATGDLHMVVSGEKNGVAGFYYVKP